MYQRAEETHEGIWEMPYLGLVPYYVELEQSEPWNYQIGMVAGLGEHWNLTLEGGVGSRKSVLANIEYRFGSRYGSLDRRHTNSLGREPQVSTDLSI